MSVATQPTRILVVGAGGREHALAWKLAAEPGVNEVVVAPGSDAIALEPRVRRAAGVDPLDPVAIVALARERAVELAVIGPEAPLAAGVADALVAAGIPTFGPSAAAARIESSKSFCHEIGAEAGVPMARSATFAATDVDAAGDWAADEAARPGSRGVVVKADGLAGGKGVIVCDTGEDARRAIADLIGAGVGVGAATGVGVERLVLEERLEGPEATVIAICDGRTALALPAARDHKRLGDGDTGPNTGGMGAYSPLPDLGDDAIRAVLETVHRPILAALARRGLGYRGFLYAGLMLTAAGTRLLECNARLGDPEAQAILPRVAVPLGPILLSAARGRLDATAGPLLPVLPGSTVAIVLAAAGYPSSPERGAAIAGLDPNGTADGALVFHAGTRRDDGRGWRVDGGRVLSVVGRGADLAAARGAAERAAETISWPGMQRRHDLAADAPSMAGAGR